MADPRDARIAQLTDALHAINDQLRSDPDMSGKDRWHQLGPVTVGKLAAIARAALNPCDCHLYERQVCDICQKTTGDERDMDAVPAIS